MPDDLDLIAEGGETWRRAWKQQSVGRRLNLWRRMNRVTPESTSELALVAGALSRAWEAMALAFCIGIFGLQTAAWVLVLILDIPLNLGFAGAAGLFQLALFWAARWKSDARRETMLQALRQRRSPDAIT